MDNDNRWQSTTTSIAIIAIVAALAMLGIVAVTVATIPQQQQAEARGCESGAMNFTPIIASERRCLGH